MMTDIPSIQDEPAYDAALAEAEYYFKIPPEPGTLDAERFNLLITSIAEYEARRWSIYIRD